MEIKQVKPKLVAMHSFKTRLSKIQDAVGVKPNEVLKELKMQGMQPSDVQIWSYSGCDIFSDVEFDLDICLPVVSKGQDTNFIQFRHLPELKCATYLYNGPWSKFGEVYQKLLTEITESGKKTTGKSREVYLHCDFEDQAKCITEIQIEVN